MFNNKRIHQLESDLKRTQGELCEARSRYEARLAALEEALEHKRDVLSVWLGVNKFVKSSDLSERVDRIMQHLGLVETFVPEHTTITKKRK